MNVREQSVCRGNYAEAIVNYKRGMTANNIDNDTPEMLNHKKLCQHGIARASIKNGEYRKGVRGNERVFLYDVRPITINFICPLQISLATEFNDKQLLQDCGEALVAIGHLTEAAHLYEQAASWDDACQLYAQLKAWNKVHSILPHVTTLKMHGLYAHAKESEGKYLEAIQSYIVAGEKDNAVRLYLDHLSDPHSAAEIVMDTKSIEGSKMLAR